jgi:hypothetical protein
MRVSSDFWDADEFPDREVANTVVVLQCKCGMGIDVTAELSSRYYRQECCNMFSHFID